MTPSIPSKMRRFRLYFIAVVWFILPIPLMVLGYPPSICGDWMKKSSMLNDMAMLADSISSSSNTTEILGVIGTVNGCNNTRDKYQPVYEKDGLYDTRMRIYRIEGGQRQGDLVIVFRPTQQNFIGTSIHTDRRMVPCEYLGDGCKGLVMERFQEAFTSLVEDGLIRNIINDKVNIYITGHSLGGTFSVMMGIYLYEKLEIRSKIILSMAGPFFGDTVFNQQYLTPLFDRLRDELIITETINIDNPSEFDGTIEGYLCDIPPDIQPGNQPDNQQIEHQPDIDIPIEMICGLPIYKIEESYGMHDLRNYKEFFTGTVCTIYQGDRSIDR